MDTTPDTFKNRSQNQNLRSENTFIIRFYVHTLLSTRYNGWLGIFIFIQDSFCVLSCRICIVWLVKGLVSSIWYQWYWPSSSAADDTKAPRHRTHTQSPWTPMTSRRDYPLLYPICTDSSPSLSVSCEVSVLCALSSGKSFLIRFYLVINLRSH